MKTRTIYFVSLITIAIGVVSYYFTIKQTTSSEKKHVAKEFKKPPRGNYALMNAEYTFEKTRNPFTNSIPSDQKAKELEFAKKLPKKDPEKGQDWDWRGPDNIGGRMLCLTFDIEDENIILAGSASGGMWRSVDQGQEWAKVTAPNVEQSATCVAQDTRTGKSETWYYGTGELLSTTNRNEHLRKGEYSVNYDAGNLPPGIYYVSLKADGEIYTQKIVVY